MMKRLKITWDGIVSTFLRHEVDIYLGISVLGVLNGSGAVWIGGFILAKMAMS